LLSAGAERLTTFERRAFLRRNRQVAIITPSWNRSRPVTVLFKAPLQWSRQRENQVAE
jgi:hypothetical protein